MNNTTWSIGMSEVIILLVMVLILIAAFFFVINLIRRK
ncbi:hypothetical protein CLV99_3182 [Sphingobacterium yanglingense]|uniref:Uncharacterized protein n=1 Tax=Sphingobacterium yanglingense TaxID=1437280 RepID=A0A4R6WB28_9SPHI|nr:hypothetical protein CLV99_3182 [Sphingobacterium yanglingense]